MGIHYLNAVQAVDCIVIHRNPDAEKEYFLKEYSLLASGAMTTGH